MKFINNLFLFIILFAFFPEQLKAEWRFISPMPNARYGHDATLGPDGKIYVMGGFVWYMRDGKFSNICYDPKSDKWEILEPVPGYKEEKVYWSFDNPADKWQKFRKIKEGEYLISKVNEKKYSDWFPMDGPVPVDKLRESNYGRQGDGTRIITGKNGLIYWIGGGTNMVSGNRGEDIVFPYDPVKRGWLVKVEIKRIYDERNKHGGGRGGTNKYRTAIPPMLERRIDHEAVVTADGKIYVMGGRRKVLKKKNQFGGVTDTGLYEVSKTMECYDSGKGIWEYKKPMSMERFLFAAVTGPDNRIYTFGGMHFLYQKDEDVPSYDNTEVYDSENDTWTILKPMPVPLSGHAAVLGSDNKIYIMGGVSSYNGPPLKSVFIYDPAKDRWSRGPDMRLPRASLAAVATPDGKIYVMGGTDSGAYEDKEAMNFWLPKEYEYYTGKVQDTAEVLDIGK